MSDDESARHRIGGNFPNEPIDSDIARDHSNPPAPVSTRRNDRAPAPGPHVRSSPLLRIPAAQEYLGGMCKTTLYELIAKGELEVVRLGGSTFITLDSANGLIGRNKNRAADKLAIESAKKAARESVIKRKERDKAKKLKLVPGKQRRRREQRAAAP
jgi:hypothetical protein